MQADLRADPQADQSSRCILVAQADPIRRAELLTLLEGLGYSTESCAGGVETLDRMLAPEPPFAAFIDFDMPGLDCPQICRQISLRRPNFPTWVIAVDDPVPNQLPNLRNVRSTEILESGVSDLLTRPFGELELRLRLQTAERVYSMKQDLDRSIEATRFQASHDPLTGLWNREALLALLAQETERVRRSSAPMSIVLMDLDHFGRRNLEFGYAACDAVLRQIAVRLRRHLRSYDILGRSGEDEFLIALPGCELDDAITMAERFRTNLMNARFHTRGASFNLSASFGVTQSAGRLPLIVLREAELALAAAKEAGRNKIRFLTPNQHLDHILPNAMQDFFGHLPGGPQPGGLSVMPLLSTRKTHFR